MAKLLCTSNIQNIRRSLLAFKYFGKKCRVEGRVGDIFPPAHNLIFLTEGCKYAHKMLGELRDPQTRVKLSALEKNLPLPLTLKINAWRASFTLT